MNLYFHERFSLFSALDEVARGWAMESGAAELVTPAVIHRTELERIHYFDSFPHQLCNVSSLDCSALAGGSGAVAVNPTGYYLLPAACLHVYPALKNGGHYRDVLVTTLAKVFRYEAGEYSPNRYLEFNVREIVLSGGKDFVLSGLDRFKKRVGAFFSAVGVGVNIAEANDHFYPNQKNAIKEKMQKASRYKFEILAQVGGRETALGSFNYHGNSFSEAYGFGEKGSVVTGCIGFGLDRCVNALLENTRTAEDLVCAARTCAGAYL
jgi:seryl-tRNA synthetase